MHRLRAAARVRPGEIRAAHRRAGWRRHRWRPGPRAEALASGAAWWRRCGAGSPMGRGVVATPAHGGCCGTAGRVAGGGGAAGRCCRCGRRGTDHGDAGLRLRGRGRGGLTLAAHRGRLAAESGAGHVRRAAPTGCWRRRPTRTKTQPRGCLCIAHPQKFAGGTSAGTPCGLGHRCALPWRVAATTAATRMSVAVSSMQTPHVGYGNTLSP